MTHDNHINKHKFQESDTSPSSTNSTECRTPKSHLNVRVPFAGIIRAWTDQPTEKEDNRCLDSNPIQN